MKVIVTSFVASLFMFLLSLGVNAQLTQKSLYHDNGVLKEQCFFLDADSTILDSTFISYNANGLVKKNGTFVKGQKFGHWAAFNQLNIVYTGTYSEHETFTGFRFYFQEDTLNEVEYYENDNLIELQRIQIDSMISQLLDGFQSVAFASDSCFAQDMERLKEVYSSLQANTEAKLFEMYDLLYRAHFLNEWYSFYHLEIAELNLLKDRLALVNAKKVDESLLANLEKLNHQLDSLCKTCNYAVIGKHFFISGNLDALEADNKLVLAQSDSVTEAYNYVVQLISTQYQSIYENEFAPVNSDLQDYASQVNVKDKLQFGDSLIQYLYMWKERANELTAFDSLYNDKVVAFKDETAQSFPAIYKNVVIVFDGEKTKYDAISELDARMDFGRSLIQSIDSTHNMVVALKKSNALIAETFQPLHDQYLQEYPPIYRKEIKPYKKVIAENENVQDLGRKYQMAMSMVDTISYYKSALQVFHHTDSVIAFHYPQVKKSYETDLKSVYKQSFILIEPAIRSYNIISKAEEKIKLSQEILFQIEKLETDKTELDHQLASLTNKIDTIDQFYLQPFPAIHKQLAKQLEKDLKFYKAENTVANRLRSGTNLLTRVNSKIESFDTLMNQHLQIERELKAVRSKYEIMFPRIFKIELSELEDEHKLYVDEVSVERKLMQGGIILNRLEQFETHYGELSSNETLLKNNFEPVTLSYKENFSSIYKGKIVPLIAIKKEYDNTGYHQRKLNLGQSLVTEIEVYQLKLDSFTIQMEAFRVKYDRFVMLYQSRKAEKYIYKRGKSAYEDLRALYTNEIDLNLKMKRGAELELLLDSLIALAGQDNTELNAKLKNAKTTEEIKSKLGLSE